MQSRKTTTAFNLLLLLVFCLFIWGYEGYSSTKKQADIDIHAQVVASSVWTLFTPVTEQYLSLSVRNNDYQQVQITSLGDSVLFSYSTELTGFETVLFNLKLIRIEKYTAPVVYKDQQIGSLIVHAFNKNIYLYGYVFIVLFLTGLLSWFVTLIYSERKNLQLRVAEKTAELASNNQKLQTEIIERKQSEKALRQSERTFLTLFDYSFQFIVLLDPDCRVKKSNKTALKFRNLSEADVVGQYFWDTPWWQHSEILVKQLKDAYAIARTGETARFVVHSTAIREVYLDVTLKPVLDENQQVLYILAEGRDITDVRRAEKELQQAQKMESVGTLAGGIAHDFNNILGGILGTLALLKLKREKGKPLSDEKLFGHLDTVTETAMRAKDMVNQLLALSRKYDLKFKPVNLQSVLQNVCQIAKTSFDKSITIDAQIDSPIPIKADANSLEQVFLNICINAAHAMTIMRPPNESWGGTLSIRQASFNEEGHVGRPAGEYWKISLEDTGVGMDSANLEQIFVPFFTTKTKDAGSGLGLSMVYNIIKQHKGFIDVESVKGDGTTFHIYLPVSYEEQLIDSGENDKLVLESGEGVILVIDDEELIRNSAAEMLEECGYQVIKAENGQLGVEQYQQHQNEINAVLLDLVMPVLSGKETFTALKELNPEVKVLLSSGFRHDARVDEILAAGASNFIQKPYSIYDLSKAIKNLLT